jgi:oligopeptide/dipeptide ABC transporter ATP-binding protein
VTTAQDRGTGTDTPMPTQEPPELDELIKLEDVTVVYDKTVVAVDHVSFAVRQGHTLGIVGETGSGKSTLANVVMGIIEPTSGKVLVSGHDLAEVRGRDRLTLQRLRQVVMQDPFSSLNGRSKIRDIIAEPLTLGRRALRSSARKKINDRVLELLELVGLPKSRATYYPHQFSGGQRQRISIARALAPDPKIVVLDEPTSALDVSVRAQILTLLKSIQQRLGVTFLVISHDFVTVSYLASTVAVMHRGRIVEIGPTGIVYDSPRHPYTQRLVASIPTEEGDFLLNTPPPPTGAEGELPETACGYALRCELRTKLGNPSRCLEEDPALISVGQNHRAACHFISESAETSSGENL